MSLNDKLDFHIKTLTSNDSLSYCLCLLYPNQTDEAFMHAVTAITSTILNVSISMRRRHSTYQYYMQAMS